jgi:hypothetical protein
LSDRIHGQGARATAAPSSRRATTGLHPLAGLQQAAGNRAVQRLLSGEPAALDGEAISQRIGAAEGGGSALDATVRQRLSEALGADPGNVRVHTDGEADDLSRSLSAKAFTSGRDIFFRGGTFDPASPEGFELLVHESTHVLQQAEGPVPGTATADGALAISDPGDAFEQAASSKAEAQSAAAPIPSGDARPVQRWPDMGDLLGVAEQSGQPPGPLGGMLGTFGGAISDDASSGQLGTGTLQKAAKGEEARERAQGANIRASEKEFDADVDSASSWLGSGAKSLAKSSGTGSFGQGIADTVDSAGRFTGGFAKEIFGMGAGLDSIVQNPLGFQQAQSARAEKEAVPMATNQYFDSLGKISRGEEGLGDAAGEIFGAFSKGKDNEWAAKEAAAKPIVDDVNSGNYAGAFGRFGAQVGVAVLGMGEEGPLGELGAEASAGEKGVAVASEEGAAASETGGARGFTPRDPLPHPLDGPLPAEDPGVRIVPRNPELAAPGGDGFFEAADPLADTQRVPEAPVTKPGIGPDFVPEPEPPATRRDSGPPTLREDGPPVFDPADSPLARSVDGSKLPGLSPADSPLARSVDGSQLPGLKPAEPAGPVSEPAPISEPPLTVDSKRLGGIEQEFEKAWEGFSDLPFERGLLPD